MTQFAYHSDSTQWGQYQYTSLEGVINNYMAIKNSDDYDFTTPRYTVLGHARRISKEFYFDILQEIKVQESTLGSNLQIVLPSDYVDYVRISTRDGAGVLYPMSENKTLNLSKNYLQDHNYNLLFDADGNILQGSKKKDSQYQGREDLKEYIFCGNSGGLPSFNRNMANVHERGSYTIDKNSGVIRFSSSVERKDVVLEYISDGFFIDDGKSQDESVFKVHKFAENALIDGIYFMCIKNRRNIPANEKARARKEYHNSRRIAKRRINNSNKQEFVQAMRGSNVWNKNS